MKFLLLVSSVMSVRFHQENPVVVDAGDVITLEVERESPRDGSRATLNGTKAFDFLSSSPFTQVQLQIPSDAESGFQKITVETETGAQCKHFLFIK